MHPTLRHTQQKKLSVTAYGVLILLIIAIMPEPARSEESLWQSLISGQPDLNLRYRFEHADDGKPGLRQAFASTLRTAAGYRTGEFHDISLYFQVQDVRVVGNDLLFNDGSNNNPGRAVIADGESTEIQQYNLRYGGLPKTVVTLGRQQFSHRQNSAPRFLGDVSFRQHHQSLDAVRVLSLALPQTIIDYSYFWNVNRIFGENNSLPDAADFRSNSHALNVQYTAWPGLKLESYLYLLEFTSPTARKFSTATAGLRLQGDQVIAKDLRLNYTGEFAHQQDYSNNPNPISANYALAEAGLNYTVGATLESVGLKYSYERLEGGGGANAFQTPLGTNHAFQGFADRFLITPGDGIQDHFFTLSGKMTDTRIGVIYHQFLSDHDSYDFGHEWDFFAEHDFGRHFQAGIKYANYQVSNDSKNQSRNAGAGQAYDLARFWAYVQYSY